MKFLIVDLYLLGLCALCTSKRTEEGSYPRVITPLGTIEGFYNTSYGGKLYEAYVGIPYARPPVGKLRFEVPKSISPWTGVMMAKRFGSPCMQYNFLTRDPAKRVEGSEDCLYLNIYTPVTDGSHRDVNRTQTNLFPVIFYIPGGVFLIGNGSGYGPKYLLDRNVTLVTINYRLGPLGFLSTEDAIVPGNMGLKDQVIALRWVKDNIQSFGGDPSRITLFGQSAGGVSVQYHYLTNQTTGLFQGGMSLSGTALNPWALVKNPLDKTEKLAMVVGCPTNNIQFMVDCLKSRPAHQIVDAVSKFTVWRYHPTNLWRPSVEKGGGEFTFIDRSPIDIIASGDVQDVTWITGVVSGEGLSAVSYYMEDEDLFEILDDTWETLASNILNYDDTIPKSNQTDVATKIKQHYFGESSISKETSNKIAQMMGDRLFVYTSETAARSQALANRSPVHAYYFSYRGAHGRSESISAGSENFGVRHGEDMAYVLDWSFDPTTTAQDRKMQKLLIDLWVSFATNGTPDVGVEWLGLNRSMTDDYRYLHIAGPDEMAMESDLNFGEKNFWSTLGFQENILRSTNFRRDT